MRDGFIGSLSVVLGLGFIVTMVYILFSANAVRLSEELRGGSTEAFWDIWDILKCRDFFARRVFVSGRNDN